MSTATAPTPEQLKAEHDAAVQTAAERMFNTAKHPVTAGQMRQRTPKETKQTAPEPPKETTPAAAPTPPPAEPAKETPAQPATPPTPPSPPTTEPASPTLANLPKPQFDKNAVREAVRETLEEIQPAPAPAPVTPSGPTLTAKEQNMLAVFQKMAALNPVYKGLAEKVIAFWKSEQDWIATWEKANPGKAYAQSDDYQEWLEANEPQYDEDDFDTAKEALMEDRVTAKVEKKNEAKAKVEEAKQRAVRERPVIDQIAHGAVAQMVANSFIGQDGKLPPEVESILVKDGKIIIDDTAAGKLQEHDPALYQTLLEEGEKLHVMTHALEAMSRGLPLDEFRKGRRLKISGEVLSPIEQLDIEADEIEKEMLKMPKEETTDKAGREFVGIDQWNKEIDRIAKLPQDKQPAAVDKLNERYWHLGPEQLLAGLTGKFAAKVKNRAAVMNDVLDRKAKKGSAPVTPPGQGAPETPPSAPPTEPMPAAAKEKSPATVSRSDTPDKTPQTQTTKEEDLKNINRRMGWS